MDNRYIKILLSICVTFVLVLVADGCGGTSKYTIGGTISGLSGTVVLTNNTVDDLTLTADGMFAFGTSVDNNANYIVAVKTQPSGQTCAITSATGTVSEANVTNVTVTCANTYAIGGTASGLGTGDSVTLQNNGADDLAVSANGSFYFNTRLANNAPYDATVSVQPSAARCVISGSSGSVIGNDVTTIQVTCHPNKKVFVTNLQSSGAGITGISGADSDCMSDSLYPGTGTYKALLEATTRQPGTNWVLEPYTAYYRTDGTTLVVITDGNGTFAPSAIVNPFTAVVELIWTGFTPPNWSLASNCGDWSAATSGCCSDSSFTLANSICGLSCLTNFYYIICVEQ